MKALLIEDDEQCARMISKSMDGLTQRVDVTDKLSNALEMICDVNYNAIWLDLSLTDSDSEHTLEAGIPEIRKRCPTATLLVVSGYGETYRKKALELGADVYASKLDLNGFQRSAVVQLLTKAATHAMERGVDASLILQRVASFLQKTETGKLI